jgi:preprotein translocase subunit SecE
MRDSENKTGAAVEPREARDQMADEPISSGGSVPIPAPRQAGGPTGFSLYKAGQGASVRWGSAIGAGVIAIAGVRFVYERMPLMPWGLGDNFAVKTLVPVALLVVVAWVIFWLVGQKRGIVDFMIATEGEMKKVSWSTRREVLGATKVVIVTVLALGTLLFVVDILFMVFFSWIKVLRIDVFGNLFGGGQAQS